MSCLRHICGISLKDHISNAAILSACQAPSMESQLRSKRLRWYGHVCRMLDSRLPKVMFLVKSKVQNPQVGLERSGMTLSCLTFNS